MMTKRYIFTAVSSTLLLFLVVPSLNETPWTPAEVARVAALSAISTALAGLAAEGLFALLSVVTSQEQNLGRENVDNRSVTPGGNEPKDPQHAFPRALGSSAAKESFDAGASLRISPRQPQRECQGKDQIVDALLGKAKVGGK